jgi:hypothetical protein
MPDLETITRDQMETRVSPPLWVESLISRVARITTKPLLLLLTSTLPSPEKVVTILGRNLMGKDVKTIGIRRE